ncbi:MAG: membrane protein insertase YidC [Planctomycetota bacterium]|nr:MAG: membrane protein insertase YidC [Planctomycetota bacterium]
MDRRFLLFAVLVAVIFVVNQIVWLLIFPPEPKAPRPVAEKKAAGQADPGKKDAQDAEPPAGNVPEPEAKGTPDDAEAPPQDAREDEQPAVQAPQQEIEPQRGALGSLDPASPYRMAVTWNNRGGAIEVIELNSPDYRALDSFTGYLGYLAPFDAPKRAGALVRVVGDGSPAAAAGLEAGDVIHAIGETKIKNAQQLIDALKQTEPGQEIGLSVDRDGEAKQLTATLGHHPLELVRPEYETKRVEIVEPGKHDPLSFLTTIQQYDDRSLSDDNKELGGVHLRTKPWEVVEADDEHVVFRAEVPILNLEVTKTFRLARVPQSDHDDATFPAYDLTFDVSVKNLDDEPHEVAYRQDGPTGLPTEGYWYASKVSHEWFGSAGLRDVIVKFEGRQLDQVAPSELNDEDFEQVWGATASLDYIAVDAQYFAAALIPRKAEPDEIMFERILPLKVGTLPKDGQARLLDVSFRLDSKAAKLEPDGAPLADQFRIFAGPKVPELLSQYGQPGASLGTLVNYGLFSPISRLLGSVLHFFYSFVGNYGIAIVMLTVLVRGCMFPISRKQALGAQKMQELQPEMKRIAEKYKNDPEKRTRATQELFRSHNYNPLGGCLLAFFQLPIFMGLYRSLMVDIELRQAPLISENIRWASNLAAPDMFWNWTGVMPEFITSGTGLLGLGPYLNILPLFTVGLFITQQRMFMPPAADEQSRMQQKMMQYMMIFMGVLFFKVASGLCVYFIASSLWGICERKLLPKAKAQAGGEKAGGSSGASVPVATPSSGGNGAPAGKRKRQKGRK